MAETQLNWYQGDTDLEGGSASGTR
jgi:hypothetical protein